MRFRIWLIALFFFISACASVPTGQYGEKLAGGERAQPQDTQLVVWMLSDIQPATKSERIFFEKAVKDVNENIDQVDVGLIAGDLLKSRSQDEAFNWFLQTRNGANVRYWYEIAGNHDVRSGKLFRKYFPHPSHYGVELGNVLFLFLSDESTASQTEISEEAFNWWREMVENNQDRIIVTVTHAQLRQSGLLGSLVKSRRIKDSARFEEVLKKNKVAIWASGHSHLPQGMSGTVIVQRKLGGTCFVNVSSIGEGKLMDSQSRFLVFDEGSDTVWIRSRNHSKRRFDRQLDIPLKLEKPFSRGVTKPHLLTSLGSGN